jgi:hypothetical protein
VSAAAKENFQRLYFFIIIIFFHILITAAGHILICLPL